MWKKAAAAVGAGVCWGVGIADLLPQLHLPLPASQLIISTAVVLTGFVMMRCYQRPLGAAYDLGYKAGRRDAVIEANRRDNVTNIRHRETARALSRVAGGQLRDEVDA